MTNKSGEAISVVRRKLDSYKEDIIENEEIERLARSIDKALGNGCTNNVQFIYSKEEDRYYLLEVNARPSGGLIYSIEMSGINLMDIAMHNIYSEDCEIKVGKSHKELYKVRGFELR